jgi:protein involved in polysaccharide export with SLBB domain
MKLLTQTLVLAIALTISATAFAQTPTSVTRQRKATPDNAPSSAQPAATEDKPAADAAMPADKPVADAAAPADKDADKKPDKKVDASKDKKAAAEVTADAQTNRTDQSSEEAAIVPYYNNFFMTYRLGPEDVISVMVFGQDRYSKQGIVIPPSGRISLTLIPEGIFVNGKTVDQVAELIKKHYNEYIIDPQVSVSLDRAGSYRYSVVGDVGIPGIKPMTRRLSVSEAIAEAGGVLQTGNRKKITVLRKQANGTLAQIPVNLSSIYNGKSPDSVYLVPGDQIIVPGNTLKKLQTIMGFAQVASFARVFTGGW